MSIPAEPISDVDTAVSQQQQQQHQVHPVTDLQDIPLDPEIAIIPAIPVSDASAAVHSILPVQSSSPTSRCGTYASDATATKTYTIPAAATSPTASPRPQQQQYAVSPDLYGNQVAQSRRRNCLICGSIAATAGVVCCLFCLLPLIIFLIAWSQMNKSFNDSVSSYDGY